jgi:hypothetical protein
MDGAEIDQNFLADLTFLGAVRLHQMEGLVNLISPAADSSTKEYAATIANRLILSR